MQGFETSVVYKLIMRPKIQKTSYLSKRKFLKKYEIGLHFFTPDVRQFS